MAKMPWRLYKIASEIVAIIVVAARQVIPPKLDGKAPASERALEIE